MILTVAVLIASAYALILLLANRLAQKTRARLFALAEELYKDRRTTSRDKKHLDHLMDTYVSFRVSLLVPLAFLISSFEDLIGKETKSERRWFSNDVRYHRIISSYFWSLAACNPGMLLLSLVPLILLFAAATLIRKSFFRREVEGSILRAADNMEMPAVA